MQMNFSSLETAQTLMCVNMWKTHRQRELSSLLAIFIFFPVWGPAVLLRLLCQGTIPGFPHLSIPCIRCSSWLFALNCWGTVNRCLHLLWLRGRFRGRSYIVITHFKFNFSPCFQINQAINSKQHCQKSWAFIHFLISTPCIISDTPKCSCSFISGHYECLCFLTKLKY